MHLKTPRTCGAPEPPDLRPDHPPPELFWTPIKRFDPPRGEDLALAALGWELVQTHLLKTVPQSLKIEPTPGDFQVEKPAYDTQRERLHINKAQYFSPVPQDVWEFHIGGYQVLNQYLKSRKGRTLSLDEIENIQNVVNVLRFTIDQMQRIDACWKP